MLAVTICVGSSLAHGGTSTLPFQIGALVAGSGRNAAQAGVFGSAESIALAVSMVLISPWVGRIVPRLIAIGGCAVALVANMSLMWVQAPEPQIALGALAGSGYGLVFAATVAAAAATPEPDRMYAIGNGGALVLISALLAGLPLVAHRTGPLGIFAALGVLALISSPFFLTFRVGKQLDTPQLSAWRTPGAAGLLLSWVLYSCGTAAVYAFSERIGAADC